MTLNEAIQRVMKDRPGEATDEEMVKWINDLERRWQVEQIDTHWPTWAEYQAMKAADEAQEEEVAVITSPDPVDLSEYPANVNPSEMGWWMDDPEDMTGYFKVPTTDTALVEYRQYFALPPQSMISPAYRDEWQSAYDLAVEEAAAEEEEEEEPQLLIPSPDDEVYIYWLYAKIDLRLGEIGRYNNDAMMYNAAWTAAAKRYNREHMPKGRQLRHIVYGSLPVPRPLEDPLDQRPDWFGWR